tara:strand:+ start:1696 stop:1896 length:201 start_codon:yes stop_codon:yes gene_type:complete
METQIVSYKDHHIQVDEDGNITVWELNTDGDVLGHFLVSSLKEAKAEITRIVKIDGDYKKSMKIFG